VGLLVGQQRVADYAGPVARSWLDDLEGVLAASTEADGFVLLTAAAGQAVALDADEARAAVRRAQLLHAAGGDALRPYDLGGRAVVAAAADLDGPDRRVELQRGLERLRADAVGLPHVEGALGALLAEPELAWRAYACSVLLEELEEDG
jgi:hypothetical protein